MSVPPRAPVLFMLLLLLQAALPSNALAQGEAGMNLLRYEPAGGTLNYFVTHGSRIYEHLQVGGSFSLNYAGLPLQVKDPTRNMTMVKIVERQIVADATVGLGLFNRFELMVALPMVVNQASDNLWYINRAKDTITPSGTGNLRITPKLLLLDNSQHGLGASVLLTAAIPLGDAADFLADEAPTFQPSVALDFRWHDHGSVGVNAGYIFRKQSEFLNIDVGDMVKGGLGFEIPLFGDQFSVTGDVFAGVTVEGDRPSTEGEIPAEALAGLRWYGPARLVFSLAGGAGLTTGFGNPKPRLLGMVAIDTPGKSKDPDMDRIVGDDDACPTDPEDYDAYQDDDGCPDLDHDLDQVLDTEDRCPTEAEDRDGHEDEDGCPEPDNDDDELCDPWVAEQGLADKYGDFCKGTDKCPDDAEDIDKFEDDDGCPEPDNDRDGVCDPWVAKKGFSKKYAKVCQGRDSCVNDPEDRDGYEDEDGCPDPIHDRDHDGIPDELDKCPDEKEVINGFKDEDGCPDKGVQKVIVTLDEIKILDMVYFDTGKATIKKISFSLLDQVAQTINANSYIKLIEIGGHTDDVGDDESNLRLSQARAESVGRYLIEQEVNPKRLSMKGYGETTPLVDIRAWIDNPKELRKHAKEVTKARSQNRRVEFKILEQVKQIEKEEEIK